MANLITFVFKAMGQRQTVAAFGQVTAAAAGPGQAAQLSQAQIAAAHKKNQRAMRGGAVAMGRLSRAATVTGIATGALGVAAYKAFAEYQSSLNIFQAVTGALPATMREAGDEAKRLGADIRLPGISAKDAADTMMLLSKAGFKAPQAIKATEGALLLSRAAMMDTNESTTILARTLKAFEMPVSDATKVVDALAGAELKTTATMREIADGLTYTAASAHTLNTPMLDTVTALAKLNDAGVSGTKAGTSLNQTLGRMVAPVKQGRLALKALHLWTKRGTSAFFDMNGEFVGLRRASELLSTALQGVTREGKQKALRAIFGREGERGAGIVLQRGAANWDLYAKEVGKAGQASTLANARLKGSKAAIEAVRNAWSTFLITLGEAEAPWLDPLLLKFGTFINFLGKHPETVKNFMVVVLGLTTAIVGLNIALVVQRNLSMLAESYRVMGGLTRLWAAATWLLNAAFIASPVGWIILGLIALGVVFFVLYKKVGWFRAGVDWLWAKMKQLFNWVKTYWPLLLVIMTGGLALAVIILVKHFDSVKRAALAVFNFIRDHWRAVLIALTGGLGLAIVLIVDNFDKIKSAFRVVIGLVKRLVNWLGKIKFPGLPGWAKKGLGVAGRAGRWAGVLPGGAAGGVVARAGVMRVGERGPEIMQVPVGARVLPLTHPAAAGGGGFGGEVVVPVQVVMNRRVVGEAVARYGGDKKARR